jgi:hypothetical protein
MCSDNRKPPNTCWGKRNEARAEEDSDGELHIGNQLHNRSIHSSHKPKCSPEKWSHPNPGETTV